MLKWGKPEHVHGSGSSAMRLPFGHGAQVGGYEVAGVVSQVRIQRVGRASPS
jgi:hypothetical protein